MTTHTVSRNTFQILLTYLYSERLTNYMLYIIIPHINYSRCRCHTSKHLFCSFVFRYLNQAMKYFNATVVVPTNFVFFTISAIIAGTNVMVFVGLVDMAATSLMWCLLQTLILSVTLNS